MLQICDKIRWSFLIHPPVNTPIRSGHETVFETSNKLQINDHLFLQPDIQYILNPGSYSHLDNALVAVLRFDFTY